MADPPAKPDLAARLRALTPARVGIGRIHSAQPTGAMLDFELAHALARDAVHAELPADFAGRLDAVEVASRAGDRTRYLQRPDLGRRLREDDAARLAALNGCELALVVADGLSASGVAAHAPAVVAALRRRLDWTIAPTIVARQARVALGDEIGAILGTSAVVVLIGERPGLSAPDSLGAYITWAPRIGRLDSERNCVSNIRPPHGLSHAAAADLIAAILSAARAGKETGVGLKLPAQPRSAGRRQIEGRSGARSGG
jgi:ethanolamine ammonia-lyase small subunit